MEVVKLTCCCASTKYKFSYEYNLLLCTICQCLHLFLTLLCWLKNTTDLWSPGDSVYGFHLNLRILLRTDQGYGLSISESQNEQRGRVWGRLPTCKCSKKYALNMMFVTNPQSHVILCHHHLLTVCISSAACPAPRWGKSWNGFSQTSSKAASTKLVFCGLPSLSSLS